MILWHDASAGRSMRWAHDINEGGGAVDIATQMKASLANANEDHGHD
jgi:hypothetical protein